MTAPRNPDRLIRAFLAEGQDELPDQVYDAVRDRIEQTNQRVVIGPWRIPEMKQFAAIGLGVAAVVVALVIGSQLVGQPTVIGPPAETPLQTSGPDATPAPPDVTADDVSPRGGALEPGTRYDVTRGPVSFTFAVPTVGWESDGRFWMQGHPGSPNHTQLSFALNTGSPGIYTDPCAHQGQELFDATSAGDAEAMASLAGVDVVNPPAGITVDGHSGTSVAIRVPEDVGCVNTDYWLFHGADCPEITVECTMYPSWLDSTLRYWFIDVDGGRLMVQTAQRYPDASPELLQELQQIVDSIQFE